MTDHLASPGDDAVELASRYLDGDLSVDERAAAESDPDVMAWVERFGGIQAALREPVEVDADRRDAAIAASLAAAETAPSEAAPPPGRDELAAARARRAGRMGRWLGAAAAVVGLAIGGAVLAANSGGDGDDSADETELQSAAVEVAPATAEPGLDQESAEDRTVAAADAPSPAMATTAEAGDSAASTAAGGEFATDPSARDQDTTGGAATETTAAAAETTAAATTVLATGATTPKSYNTPGDLQPLTTAVPVTVPDGTDAPCAGDATGELVDDEVLYADQPAAVYRDGQRRTLTVWALSTCEVLIEYAYPAG